MILPEDDKSLLKDISFVESGKTYSTNEMSCSRNIDSVNKKVNISLYSIDTFGTKVSIEYKEISTFLLTTVKNI